MRRILLLSILLITGNLAAQDVSKSFVNKDFQDERYTYFKLSADSFSTDFELKYFRELVFKSPILVIVDAHLPNIVNRRVIDACLSSSINLKL